MFKLSEKSGIVYVFAKSLISALLEDSWILRSPLAFSPLRDHVIVALGDPTPHSKQDEMETGKSHFRSIMRTI